MHVTSTIIVLCRMICLLPTAYKLLSTILLNRMRLECEGFLQNDQARSLRCDLVFLSCAFSFGLRCGGGGRGNSKRAKRLDLPLRHIPGHAEGVGRLRGVVRQARDEN